MYMSKYLVAFLPFLLLGCHWFNKDIPNEEQLLEQEIKKINWSDVDQWPSIHNCSTNLNKDIQMNCFVQVVSDSLTQILKKAPFAQELTYSDTLTIETQISDKGEISFYCKNLYLKDSLHLPIDSLLNANASKFTNIKPAIKRGIPVKSKLDLPIKIIID